MKARELLYAIGLRPRPREYTYDISTIPLPKHGDIQYAEWRHPKMRPLPLTDEHVDALRPYVKEGDVAIDIGAHAGDTTIPLALAVGPTGTVFALEPNIYTFKILVANVGLNQQRARIIPLMVAATDREADMEFEYSDPGFCNGGNHEGIAARKHAHFFKLAVKGVHLGSYLDERYPEVKGRIRFVKIDAEGYDLNIARTLEGLFRENRPYIRTEIYGKTSKEYRDQYREYLQGLGYRLHVMKSETEYLGDPLTDETLYSRKTFDIFAVPQEA